MAELLSVQVHAPVTLTSVNVTTPGSVPPPAAASTAAADGIHGDQHHRHAHLKPGDCSGAAAGRLKKVRIVNIFYAVMCF